MLARNKLQKPMEKTDYKNVIPSNIMIHDIVQKVNVGCVETYIKNNLGLTTTKENFCEIKT